MEQEVVGLEMLEKVAAALYAEKDPTQLFFRGPVQEVTSEDGRYVLTIVLPFVSKEQLSLTRAGDELTINVGSFKRSIILPRILHGLSTLGAKFEGNKLRIAFGEALGEEDSP